jgi:hypothetical protein
MRHAEPMRCAVQGLTTCDPGAPTFGICSEKQPPEWSVRSNVLHRHISRRSSGIRVAVRASSEARNTKPRKLVALNHIGDHAGVSVDGMLICSRRKRLDPTARDPDVAVGFAGAPCEFPSARLRLAARGTARDPDVAVGFAGAPCGTI